MSCPGKNFWSERKSLHFQNTNGQAPSLCLKHGIACYEKQWISIVADTAPVVHTQIHLVVIDIVYHMDARWRYSFRLHAVFNGMAWLLYFFRRLLFLGTDELNLTKIVCHDSSVISLTEHVWISRGSNQAVHILVKLESFLLTVKRCELLSESVRSVRRHHEFAFRSSSASMQSTQEYAAVSCL